MSDLSLGPKVLVLLMYAVLVASITSVPKAALFVGDGYNILKGNPDGNFWSTGGDDPGLLLSRKIFLLSPDPQPKQLQYEEHGTCHESHSFSLVYSPFSYQEKLLRDIHTSGYQAVKVQTQVHHYVYQDKETYCLVGRGLYKMSLAQSETNPLTPVFIADVCSLNASYDEREYMSFIDKWGTHVVTGVDIGHKTTQRYIAELKDYMDHVLVNASDEVITSGPYLGSDSSFQVKLQSYKYRQEYQTIIGHLQDTLQIGTAGVPEPIGLTMESIDTALSDAFWTGNEYSGNGNCQQMDRDQLVRKRTNLQMALGNYSRYNLAARPSETPLAMPITWPNGTYGLAEPSSGCPAGRTWKTGWRYQQTETQTPDNSWGNPNHFKAGTLHVNSYRLNYCIQTLPSSKFGLPWPKGDYCLFKYGSCPSGFSEGYVQWDDENTNNKNSYGGVLPDGVYNHDTLVRYCCRSDAHTYDPIHLPTEKPFYLLKYKHGCQEVYNMTISEEWLLWDDEDEHTPTKASIGSVHPGMVFGNPPKYIGIGTSSKIYYCYYQKKQALPAIIG